MIRHQNSIVVAVVILSFAFTFTAGASIESFLDFGFGENLKQDEDIFIREHENSSCTFFRSLFPKTYTINDTTTCKCVRTGWMRCTTTYIYNTTTTAPPPTTTQVSTTAKSNSNMEWTADADAVDSFGELQNEKSAEGEHDDLLMKEQEVKERKIEAPVYFGHFYRVF